MLAIGWHSLNWGDVPTWVGSVMTGAALLVAAFTYRKSVRDGAREQAKVITVWVTGDGSTAEGRTVHVKNGGTAAVYSVAVYYLRTGWFAPDYRSPYYQEADNGVIKLGSWDSLGPDQEKTARVERTLSDPAIPWLYFRDADGVDWIRDYRARLTRHNYWLMRNISESYYARSSKLQVWFKWALIIYGFMIYGMRGWIHKKLHPAKAQSGNTGEASPTNGTIEKENTPTAPADLPAVPVADIVEDTSKVD